MNPYCIEEGIAITPWSPLARGFVTGHHRPEDFGDTIRARTDAYGQSLYYQPSDFTVVERLTEVAKKIGKPNTQVALAWLLAKPGVTSPIIGTTKLSHLDDAVAALDLKLTEDDMKALEQPYQPHPVIGIE